jgi:phytoene dehydrogenase-like protein
MPSAIVIGAGLAGLSCARVLQDAGFEVEILEKSDRVGGRVKTDVVDGFRFDHGFQVLNPAYKELQRLKILEKLDLHHLPKGFEFALDGKNCLIGDPRESIKYLKGDLSERSGSLREKFAFLTFIARKPQDIDLGEAMKSSGNFYRGVVKGFLDGVFLTDSDHVSSAMAHDLLRWFMRGRPGVPALGMGELPRQLSQGLNIRFNCVVEGVREGRVSTSEGELRADFIVIAADPKTTRHLASQPDLSMNPSWTWYHAVPYGGITSKYLKVLRHDPFINSLAISNIAPRYAPSDQTLISSTTLRKISEEEAVEAVAATWRISKSELRYLSHYEIAASLPFHGPKKPLEIPQMISERIFLAGDSYSIPAQQGALRSGRMAAEMIIARQ